MSFVVKTADLTKVKSLSLALLSPHLSYTQTRKRGGTAAPVTPLLMVARLRPLLGGPLRHPDAPLPLTIILWA